MDIGEELRVIDVEVPQVKPEVVDPVEVGQPASETIGKSPKQT